jgi:alcohol dehydrogenase (cytochrome c)
MSMRLGMAAVAAGALFAGLSLPAIGAPVTPERLLNANAEPQNWLMVHQNYSNWRYSALRTINTTNVANLQPMFTVAIGGWATTPAGFKPDRYAAGGNVPKEEGVPLVEDGFMYVTDGLNKLMKIDVRAGNKGTPVWRFDPVVTSYRTNRGVGMMGNNIYIATGDVRIVAINKDTGEAVFDVSMWAPTDPVTGSPSKNTQVVTAPPFLARTKGGKNIVSIGESSGGQQGTRSWVGTANADTGEFMWRFFTVPEPGQFGADTWKNNAWITGGAGVWSHAAFDPTTNVMIHGTGDIFPSYDPEFRPGDNLFGASTIALDVDTGKLAWYFQATPSERWDLDTPQARVLYPSNAFGGAMRAVVANFERQGYYYQFNLDASIAKGANAEGVFLKASPYVDKITWTDGIDPKTGKPVEYNPALAVQVYKYATLPRTRKTMAQATMHCPGWSMQNIALQPTSFDPTKRIHYAMANEGCRLGNVVTDFRDGNNAKEWVGQGACCFTGTDVDNAGALLAMNVDTGVKKKLAGFPIPNESGVVATAGNLVFAGQMDGEVVAYNADTGAKLWGFNTGSNISAAPITYAVGDKQFVAIIVGGARGSVSALPAAGVLGGNSSVYVFGLK